MFDDFNGIMVSGVITGPGKAIEDPAFNALRFKPVRCQIGSGQGCRSIESGIFPLRFGLMPEAGAYTVS